MKNNHKTKDASKSEKLDKVKIVNENPNNKRKQSDSNNKNTADFKNPSDNNPLNNGHENKVSEKKKEKGKQYKRLIQLGDLTLGNKIAIIAIIVTILTWSIDRFFPSYKGAPLANDSVSETPVEDTPVKDDSVEDTPVENDSVTDTSVEDDSVTDTPVEDDPVTDTPVEDDPVTDASQLLSVSIDNYIKILKDESGGKVHEYFYDDFDGDGMMEMFAVITNKDRENEKYGTFWYVNQEKAIELIDEEIVDSYLYSISLNKKKILATTISYGDTVGSQFLYLWTVSNGIPQENSLSPTQQTKILSLKRNKYDEIELHTDRYDDFHEYVTYYLYYDGTDFHEYGGIQISMEDLRRVPGIDNVIDQITTLTNDGVTISDIFYRENGIIDINYVKKDGHYEYHDYLRIRLLDNGRIEYPDHGHDRGYISNAYYDRIATYPDMFPY